MNIHGLSEFAIDGVKYGMEIDSSALRHILEQTNELTKLSIRNTQSIEMESIGNLINIVSDLIMSMPPRLRELDLASIESSAE